MKKIAFVSVLVLLTGSFLSAGLPDEFKTWAEGPVSFLMTPAEQSEWAGISTADEARHFIDLFWARRDPDLGTRVNEFKQLFDARVEAADAEFGEENIRGAMTDRGKTLILMGTPKEHARGDIGEYLSRIYRTGRAPKAGSADPDAHIQMQGISFNLNKNLADLWGYSREQVPKSIEWPSREDLISFAFFDTEGDGHFKLQLGIRKSAMSVGVLRKMPEALLLHPELTEIPGFGLIPGLPAASAGQLQALEGGARVEGAELSSAIGAGGPGVPVTWLFYSTPAETPPADTLVGRLKSEDGNVDSFSMETEAGESTTGRRVYELAVPAGSGGELSIALFREGKLLDSRTLTIKAAEKGSGFMSDIFAGAEVNRAEGAKAGDPFVFGGYHLLPRFSGRYKAGEGLAVFALLSLPEGEAVPRNGSIRMRWVVDGKSEGAQPSRPIQFGPAGPGLWVWGTQLPLSSLSGEHEYKLKIRLKDSKSGLHASAEIPVRPAG